MSYRIAKKGGQLIAATFADIMTAENFADRHRDEIPDAEILLECDDGYQWSRITQALKERDELAAELESLKSRLPVNADGDVVFIGDYVFVSCRGLDHPMRLKVTGFREEDDGIYITTRNGRRLITDCHSTAESCRAAHEGKEGENDE